MYLVCTGISTKSPLQFKAWRRYKGIVSGKEGISYDEQYLKMILLLFTHKINKSIYLQWKILINTVKIIFLYTFSTYWAHRRWDKLWSLLCTLNVRVVRKWVIISRSVLTSKWFRYCRLKNKTVGSSGNRTRIVSVIS